MFQNSWTMNTSNKLILQFFAFGLLRRMGQDHDHQKFRSHQFGERSAYHDMDALFVARNSQIRNTPSQIHLRPQRQPFTVHHANQNVQYIL